MKLRLRYRKKTVVVSLQSPVLRNLKEKVAEQFNLQKFSLSLNGKDPLQGDDEQSLSQFEIVSGDLVHVLSDEPAPQDEPVTEASPSKAGHTTPQAEPENQMAMQTDEPDARATNPASEATASSSQASSGSDKAAAAGAAAAPEFDADALDNDEAIKDAEVNRYLNEPMLLQDCTEGKVTQVLRRVFEESRPHISHEAICVALHILMLESRFKAQGAESGSHPMPVNWRTPGSYKLMYTHLTCAECTFQVICVPMGPLLIVHGAAQLANSTENNRHQLQIRSSDYVQAVGQDAGATYRSLGKLSRLFKDTISYPLLQSAQPDGQSVPSLINLVYEMKLMVLKYLDVKSLLRVSRTCRRLNTAASDNILWRRLYLKDFGRRTNNDLAQNWKQFYRDKYLLRKRMREDFYRRMTVVVPPYMDHPNPPFPFAPVYPPGFIGGDYDLDPNFQGLFGQRGRGPILPRPRFDPIGPLPGQMFPPGRGGGMWESGANRRGFGGRRGGGGGALGPKFF